MSRLRVLYVDHEPMIGRLVARILDDCEVVVERAGRAAIERWAGEGPFDLVVCDMTLSDVGGERVHADLHALAPEAASRMLFVTAGTGSPAGQKFVQTLGPRLLCKPFTADLLRGAVARALGRPLPRR